MYKLLLIYVILGKLLTYEYGIKLCDNSFLKLIYTLDNQIISEDTK